MITHHSPSVENYLKLELNPAARVNRQQYMHKSNSLLTIPLPAGYASQILAVIGYIKGDIGLLNFPISINCAVSFRGWWTQHPNSVGSYFGIACKDFATIPLVGDSFVWNSRIVGAQLGNGVLVNTPTNSGDLSDAYWITDMPESKYLAAVIVGANTGATNAEFTFSYRIAEVTSSPMPNSNAIRW